MEQEYQYSAEAASLKPYFSEDFSEEEEEFSAERYLLKMSHDERVIRMKSFIQHGRVTTYEHVISVARKSVELNHRFHFHADDKQLIRGALLHDYYLYDWHSHKGEGLHGFTHPQTALEMAERDFHLTEREKNMIRSHMWPLTLFHIPKHREAWLLCLADKMVSTNETLYQR